MEAKTTRERASIWEITVIIYNRKNIKCSMGSGAEVRYLKGYRQLEDSQNCQILRLSKLKVLGPLAKTGN